VNDFNVKAAPTGQPFLLPAEALAQAGFTLPEALAQAGFTLPEA
jgi:hypothetical protein